VLQIKTNQRLEAKGSLKNSVDVEYSDIQSSCVTSTLFVIYWCFPADTERVIGNRGKILTLEQLRPQKNHFEIQSIRNQDLDLEDNFLHVPYNYFTIPLKIYYFQIERKLYIISPSQAYSVETESVFTYLQDNHNIDLQTSKMPIMRTLSTTKS
jgi:hypothetical protein